MEDYYMDLENSTVKEERTKLNNCGWVSAVKLSHNKEYGMFAKYLKRYAKWNGTFPCRRVHVYESLKYYFNETRALRVMKRLHDLNPDVWEMASLLRSDLEDK